MEVEGEEENEIFPCWYFQDLTLAWRRKCENSLLLSYLRKSNFLPRQTDTLAETERHSPYFHVSNRKGNSTQLDNHIFLLSPHVEDIPISPSPTSSSSKHSSSLLPNQSFHHGSLITKSVFRDFSAL